MCLVPENEKRPELVPASWTTPEFEADYAQLEDLIDAQWPALKVNDEPLWESMDLDFIELVDALLVKYPEHPDLLEYRAHSTEDPLEKIDFFRRAVASAVRYGFPSYVPRMRLAEQLMEYLADYDETRAVLDAAEQDVASLGDDYEREEYGDLRRSLAEIANGRPCRECGFVLKSLKEPRCPSCGQET